MNIRKHIYTNDINTSYLKILFANLIRSQDGAKAVWCIVAKPSSLGGNQHIVIFKLKKLNRDNMLRFSVNCKISETFVVSCSVFIYFPCKHTKI